jgi:hypothetical protein
MSKHARVRIEKPPLLWEQDVVWLREMMAERAGVTLDEVVMWHCPCCKLHKAMYAPSAHGVWFALTVSTRQQKAGVDDLVLCRIDSTDEIDKMPQTWPHDHDRLLITCYWPQGLKDALHGLFAS